MTRTGRCILRTDLELLLAVEGKMPSSGSPASVAIVVLPNVNARVAPLQAGMRPVVRPTAGSRAPPNTPSVRKVRLRRAVAQPRRSAPTADHGARPGPGSMEWPTVRVQSVSVGVHVFSPDLFSSMDMHLRPTDRPNTMRGPLLELLILCTAGPSTSTSTRRRRYTFASVLVRVTTRRSP